MNPHLAGPTPPSTHSSNGASPDQAQFRVVRKRNRVPLSCAPCRHRKLKCNRAHPCDNCTKRGDTQSCSYASAATRKRTLPGANGQNGNPGDMQNRIDRLESLVLSLMTNGNDGATTAQDMLNLTGSNGTTATSHSASNSYDHDGANAMEEDRDEDSDVNTVSQGIGIMKVADGGKTTFVSEAHWYAILGHIAEVKKYYAEHHDEYKAQIQKVEASQVDDAPGGSLFFRAPRFTSREEAIAPFPDKQQTDTLIGRYFNSYDPSVHIIHGPTFQKQYDEHWRNPQETPLPFIALMYSMMTLALQSYDRANDEPTEYIGRSLQMSINFRRLTAQTLVLADVTEPVSHIIETLCLHIQAEYSRSRDAEPHILLLVSMVVRLAMRMGYHRDSTPHDNVSPFQGEMRRRVWMLLRQADILFSAQASLPCTSSAESTDSEIPRNLYDDELYEEMTALPPSRPNNEPTPMSFMIAKAHLALVYGRITERMGSVTLPPTYDEILEIDEALKDKRNNLAPHLRIRPLSESMTEPANLVMQRYALELLYLKSQCVLHRRFLARGRDNAKFAYSRRNCMDASMDMLTHQVMLHRESQPGGRLHSVKWYISSLTTNDFLTAAFVVCLELHHLAEAERSGRKNSTAASPVVDFVEERREEMLATLRHSMNIWVSLRDQSMEAWKASTALRVMLDTLTRPRNINIEPSASGPAVPGATGAFGERKSGKAYPLGYGISMYGNVPIGDDKGAEQAAAMTLNLLSSGGVSGAGPQYPNPQTTQQQGQGQNAPSAASGSEANKTYPAGMAGLLNDSVGQEGRTGLTPNYSGPFDAASPFSQMFGQAGSVFDGMTQGGSDIDWGAWDSFIGGSTLDPASMWPSSVPEPNIDPAIEAQGPHSLNGIAAAGLAQGSKDGQDGVFMGMSQQGNGFQQWVGK